MGAPEGSVSVAGLEGLEQSDLLLGVPDEFQFTGYVWPINLAGQDVFLPIVLLPQGEKPGQIAIAYLNPKREGVSGAIAAGLAPFAEKQIGDEESAVFVGPPTDKSGLLPQLLSEKVVKDRPDLRGLVDHASFSGGKFTIKENGSVALPDFPGKEITPDPESGIFSFTDSDGTEIVGICYTPVTGKPKYIYLTKPQRKNFTFVHGVDNGTVFLVDDVATTFATVLAMRKMLIEYCGVPAERIKVLAAAKEGDAPLPNGVKIKALIELPEFINAF